ncbi:MAG: muconolactone Delta-isomerase family protein [Bacteroidota bacterium]
MSRQYMFELHLPQAKSEVFINLIPEQRAYINEQLSDGSIINYSVTEDLQKCYCVVEADDEEEALNVVANMPLSAFMKVDIKPLMFYNSVFHQDFHFSKN